MDNSIVEAVAAGDPLAADLVERARERARRRMGTLEERVALAIAATFVAAATAAAIFLPAVRPFSPVAAVLAVAAYAVASRVQCEVRNNFAAPTQLVLVPMLFVLPPRDVPLLVAAGYIAGELHRRTHAFSHTSIDVANAWYSLGPAVVLAFGASGRPAWHH